MRLINIEGMPNFAVKLSNGKEWVLLPIKRLYDIPTVKAIPLDKIKKAREEIRKLDDINPDYPMDRTIHVSRNEVLEIIDKLIESEE